MGISTRCVFALKYTESVGDSYDNAMAESVIGLFKTEVIRHRGPWKTLESVEYATLEWLTGSIITDCRSLSAHILCGCRRFEESCP